MALPKTPLAGTNITISTVWSDKYGKQLHFVKKHGLSKHFILDDADITAMFNHIEDVNLGKGLGADAD